MTTMRLTRLIPLFAVAFFFLGTYAYAGKITVNNKTQHEIKLAFKLYDYKKKQWVVWGWYSTPAYSSKSWSFSLAPDRKVYWYGKADGGKLYWPGKGDHGQSVINKVMDGVKADLLKTYADSKIVQFATRDPSSEGNLTITLVSTK